MKTFFTLAVSGLLLSAPALATEVADTENDAILHAIFAAFQEPAVLTAEHIAESQALLVSAAENGNYMARMVVDRGNIQAVTATGSSAGESLLVSN